LVEICMRMGERERQLRMHQERHQLLSRLDGAVEFPPVPGPEAGRWRGWGVAPVEMAEPVKYPAAMALLLGLSLSARAGGAAADRAALRAGIESALQVAEAEFIASNPLLQAGRGMPEVWTNELLQTRENLLLERAARQKAEAVLSKTKHLLVEAEARLARAELQDAALLRVERDRRRAVEQVFAQQVMGGPGAEAAVCADRDAAGVRWGPVESVSADDVESSRIPAPAARRGPARKPGLEPSLRPPKLCPPVGQGQLASSIAGALQRSEIFHNT
jgi:hypothetical protein